MASQLYRSDALQDMTICRCTATAAIDDLNIGLVVDLRNSDEAERDGRGPLPGLRGRSITAHSTAGGERISTPFTGPAMWWSDFRPPTNGWCITPARRVAAAVNAIAEAER